MGKRFFDTEMYLRPWFRCLEPRIKCLWSFMLTRCDMAGVIDIDWDLATFSIGHTVDKNDLSLLGDNVFILPCGKVFLPSFIKFQYGELKDSMVHKGVKKVLNSHGIPYPYSIDTLSKSIDTSKDKTKAKDNDKEKDKEGMQGEIDPHAPVNAEDLKNITKAVKFIKLHPAFNKTPISAIENVFKDVDIWREYWPKMCRQFQTDWAGTEITKYPPCQQLRIEFDRYAKFHNLPSPHQSL